MGTGDRLGLFRDSARTIWGLPLTIADNGNVLVCAPNTLHDAPVTDHYPAGATVIGATNEPTGWRGGTGELELLLRDGRGKIEWYTVKGSHIAEGPVCWAQVSTRPEAVVALLSAHARRQIGATVTQSALVTQAPILSGAIQRRFLATRTIAGHKS
jgi:hypothetical protein